MSFYHKILHMQNDAPVFIGRNSEFFSSVLVPFVMLDGEEYLLFEKRASGIRQAGEVCFPGGAVEKGEDPRHTAVRETVEELGISKDCVKIERHFGYLLARMGATIDVFIGRL
jgi:8-oxo-dGTP pyrophosphatase MutT (NUDIX family)